MKYVLGGGGGRGAPSIVSHTLQFDVRSPVAGCEVFVDELLQRYFECNN